MWKCIAYIFLLFAELSALTKASGESMLTESDYDSSPEDLIPTDRNSSIQYLLYTPANPEIPCYIEPEASMFDKCAFNSSYETKFIIHGFQIKLSPGNLFEKMKDTLLEYDKYNVIIVNWTRFNRQNYAPDVVNAYIVGVVVADMINFLASHASVNVKSIHLIGHSLGAQIAGVAGKHVPNLGRITGLDPAGPGYSVKFKFDRLTSADAELVDAIHSSNADHEMGFGTPYPMAWMNFYPNGGQRQPKCQMGKNYSDGDGVEHTIRTSQDQAGCNHDSSITYFISSILDCEYLSTRCKDYESYENGRCKSESNSENKMGFHCVGISGLKDHSKFYLDTSGNSPFC
ncbi:Putative endothelial lipase [Araneus ventricosus]|uniref:Endothelial lipase n=1 Tax=Araneus ventricosus TaxID=182803 RepID=A0A4Y2SVS0_ARAVE|nr:Putative endothelial lipase [Araneus ventricosus]